MSNDDSTEINKDLRHDGLGTRWGMDITTIHGFGHGWLEADEFWPDRGDWWVICDVVDPETGQSSMERCYSMSVIVHDDSEQGKANMNALSKACMDYLARHGVWAKNIWIPRGLKAII